MSQFGLLSLMFVVAFYMEAVMLKNPKEPTVRDRVVFLLLFLGTALMFVSEPFLKLNRFLNKVAEGTASKYCCRPGRLLALHAVAIITLLAVCGHYIAWFLGWKDNRLWVYLVQLMTVSIGPIPFVYAVHLLRHASWQLHDKSYDY